MQRGESPKMRLKDRRRRAWKLKAVGAAALVLVVFGAIAYATRLPEFTISSVKVEGAAAVDADSVQQTALSAIKGSYFFLIPKAFGFLVPTHTIKKAIVATYPAVADATVRVDTLNALTVTLTERKATALWCNNSCFEMDQNGFVFLPTADTSKRQYRGLLASSSPLGMTFLDGKFPALDALVTRVSDVTKHAITTVHVEANGDVFVDFDGGGEVRFVMATNTAPILSNIASVFASQDFQAKQLEYADFRFNGKALVKFAK